jgi:hypothetical protein
MSIIDVINYFFTIAKRAVILQPLNRFSRQWPFYSPFARKKGAQEKLR